MSALLIAAYVWAQVVIPGKNVIQQFGINDRGQTAVTTDDASGIYDHGTFTPLPPPPASCLCTVTAVAVNDSGVVTGIAKPTAGAGSQGFLLIGSTYTFFSWAGWPNTEPRGINSLGHVVGWGWDDSTATSAGFLYDPSTGTFTNVTPGSGYPSIVQGVNRFDRIAGTFVAQAPRKLYGLIAQMNPLSAFGATQLPFANRFQVGGAFTKARGINDFGVIVGFVNTPDGSSASFVGNDSWGYELVVPPGGDAPGTATFCTGINNFGQVACSVTDAAFNTTLGLYIGTPAFPSGH